MTSQPTTRPFDESREAALEPDWQTIPELLADFEASGARWRLDPIWHYLIVDRPNVGRLIAEYGCADVTTEFKKQLKRRDGVRVVGCELFAGMLVFDLADQLLYHVDSERFTPSPVGEEVAVHFRGLGRPAAHNVPYNFDSMNDAIEAYKGHVREAQTGWAKRHKKPETRRVAATRRAAGRSD